MKRREHGWINKRKIYVEQTVPRNSITHTCREKVRYWIPKFGTRREGWQRELCSQMALFGQSFSSRLLIWEAAYLSWSWMPNQTSGSGEDNPKPVILGFKVLNYEVFIFFFFTLYELVFCNCKPYFM